MLSRLSDHYRIVNPSPTDSVITQRRNSITEFLPQLDDAQVRQAAVDIVMAGIRHPLNEPQSSFLNSLIQSIRDKQPSFSTNINDNAIDLRVTATIAVSEYIHSKGDDALDIAALVSANVITRPLSEDKYFSVLISELISLAIETLNKSGKRKRTHGPLPELLIQGSDLPTLAKSASAALAELRQAIDQKLNTDQEELQILWWVFGRNSVTLNEPFRSMEVPERATLIGVELSDLTLVPPLPNIAQFIASAIETESSITLRQLVNGCSKLTLQSVTKHHKSANGLLRNHPAVLPLSWIFNRRLESNLSSGWEAEFTSKTDLSPEMKLSASDWATQVFRECVASKVISERSANE